MTIGSLWPIGHKPDPAGEHAALLRAQAVRRGATEIAADELEAEDNSRWCQHFKLGDTRLVRHDAVVDLTDGPLPEFFAVGEGELVWFDRNPRQRPAS